MNKNVNIIAEENLCISCGVCKSICPKNAISYSALNGMYIPCIDSDKCIDCGLCYELCPGKGCDYYALYNRIGRETPEDMWLGVCKESYNATAKDEELLKKSTSGGVVTTIVTQLLESGKYNKAFLVDTYNYSTATNTEGYAKNSDLSNTPKSRYIPVMQTNAIEHLLNNRDEKIIFVGVPCFVQTLNRVIVKYSLKRDNYFIIGLFCDKTMNYNVYDYFSDFVNNKLDKLLFRNKAASGWPGDVSLISNDKVVDLPRFERMAIKDYFVPERCLYCVDKLNQFADISVGDNYTGVNAIKTGSSSVLVCTEIGANVWSEIKTFFDYYDIDATEIKKSQKLIEKEKHLFYQKYKDSDNLILNKEFSVNSLDDNYKNDYKNALNLAELGANKRFKEIRARAKKLQTKNKLKYYKKAIIIRIKRLLNK